MTESYKAPCQLGPISLEELPQVTPQVEDNWVTPALDQILITPNVSTAGQLSHASFLLSFPHNIGAAVTKMFYQLKVAARDPDEIR